MINEIDKKKCTCEKPQKWFSEDGLIEWCVNCGKLICDHHERLYGKQHPTSG